MIQTDFRDLNEASLLWNLKIRYDKELIYVCRSMLIHDRCLIGGRLNQQLNARLRIFRLTREASS